MTEKIEGFQIIDAVEELGEVIVARSNEDELFGELNLETLPLDRQKTKIQNALKPNKGHTHHWVIETPNGKTSQGCCEGCGGTREFQNFLPELEFVIDRNQTGGRFDW